MLLVIGLINFSNQFYIDEPKIMYQPTAFYTTKHPKLKGDLTVFQKV